MQKQADFALNTRTHNLAAASSIDSTRVYRMCTGVAQTRSEPSICASPTLSALLGGKKRPSQSTTGATLVPFTLVAQLALANQNWPKQVTAFPLNIRTCAQPARSAVDFANWPLCSTINVVDARCPQCAPSGLARKLPILFEPVLLTCCFGRTVFFFYFYACKRGSLSESQQIVVGVDGLRSSEKMRRCHDLLL